MIDLDLILNQISGGLQVRYPGRLVTRTLKDVADRPDAELAQGVYTLISRGQTEIKPGYEFLKLIVVGQVLVPENSDGLTLERAEIAMVQELKAFVAAPGIDDYAFRLERWVQSAQLEAPYGWINAELRVGPLLPD